MQLCLQTEGLTDILQAMNDRMGEAHKLSSPQGCLLARCPCVLALQCSPRHNYSEAHPAAFSGAYSQISDRIAVSMQYGKGEKGKKNSLQFTKPSLHDCPEGVPSAQRPSGNLCDSGVRDCVGLGKPTIKSILSFLLATLFCQDKMGLSHAQAA